MNGPSSITGLSDNVGASAEALNNAGRHIETLTAKINDQAQDLQALTTKCGNLELAAKEFADHTARDEAAKNALAEAVAGLKQVVMDPQRAKAAEKTADKKPTDAETLEALASKVDNQAADFRTLASVCMEIRVAIAGSDEVQAPEGLVEKIDALISICKGIEGASTSCQHSEAVNTLPDNMESLTSVCQEIKAALAGSDEAQAPEGLVSRTESLTSVCAEIKSATEGPAKAVENLAEKIDLSGSKLDAIGETHAELSNLASTLKRRLDDDEEMRETKRRRLAHPLSELFERVNDRFTSMNLRLEIESEDPLPIAISSHIMPILASDARHSRVREFAESETRVGTRFCCAAVGLYGRNVGLGDCRCTELFPALQEADRDRNWVCLGIKKHNDGTVSLCW